MSRNSKIALSYVSALLMLFSQGYPAFASSPETISPDSILNHEEQDYTPFEMKTIFNMTDEESEKIVRLSDIVFLIATIKGERCYIPCLGNTMYAVSNYDEKLGPIFQQLLIDDIKEEYYKNLSYKVLIEKTFIEFREISSNFLIMIQDKSGKYLDYSYFMPNTSNKKEKKDVNIGYNYFGNFFEDRKDLLDIRDTRMSLKEFLEFYKKEINPIYWPVRFKVEKNENPSFPTFNEDFLNKEISNVENTYVLLDDNKNVLKVVMVREDKDCNKLDLLTGEVFHNTKKDDYPKNYLSNIGVQKIGMKFLLEDAAGVYVNFLEKYPEIDIMVHKVIEAETYGELIDAYQYLPLEFQVDYSYFDFSNSPHVDPAWLANRPAPPPTPTPPPYAELTIGSSGQEVLAMKLRFYELGYFRNTDFNDRFMDNTADTVRLFEKNNSLPVDGIADALMLGVLFSNGAVGK